MVYRTTQQIGFNWLTGLKVTRTITNNYIAKVINSCLKRTSRRSIKSTATWKINSKKLPKTSIYRRQSCENVAPSQGRRLACCGGSAGRVKTCSEWRAALRQSAQLVSFSSGPPLDLGSLDRHLLCSWGGICLPGLPRPVGRCRQGLRV